MEFKKIVVGTDFSDEANVALKQAINIARHTGAELVLVHAGTVHESLSEGEGHTAEAVKEYEAILAEHLADNRRQLDELRERNLGQGVEVSHMVIDGFPDTALRDASKDLGADLVVIGTHGRTGIKRFLLGSVAERVVRLCNANVMVARKDHDAPSVYKRILVPTDFSEIAERALEAALLVAGEDAQIDLLHCWQLPAMTSGYYVPGRAREAIIGPIQETIEEGARQRAQELLDKYRREGVSIDFDVTQAAAAHGIQERAEGYDLIVMGSHGRRGVRRLLLGSVAEVTVRHAPCSVIIIHPGEE